MSLTKVTFSMIKDGYLNLKDYGAVGDNATNDTVAWGLFIADCIALDKKGYIPQGTYLIDSFTFGPSASGLILEGATHDPYGQSFGLANTTIKLRTASAKFINMSAVYNLKVSNLVFDGAYLADVVMYFDGAVNTPGSIFRQCTFANAVPTTGIIHSYDGGSVGGENNKFYDCFLTQTGGTTTVPATYKAAYCVKFNNTNAFLMIYDSCEFIGANILVEMGPGSANLLTCKFFDVTTAMVQVVNGTQSVLITNPYNEGSTNVPFLKQLATAGATSSQPLVIIAPQLNSAGSGLVLNCQQPVCVYGGRSGGDIDVTPVATYGLAHNIIDSVYFNSGYGITGTGAITQTISRGCAVNFVQQNSQFQNINLKDIYVSGSNRVDTVGYTIANGGATPSVVGMSFVNITNSAPQNITFLTGSVGQSLVLYFSDANTTLVHSANFVLQGSANVTPTAKSTVTMLYINTNVWVETARSIK